MGFTNGKQLGGKKEKNMPFNMDGRTDVSFLLWPGFVGPMGAIPPGQSHQQLHDS